MRFHIFYRDSLRDVMPGATPDVHGAAYTLVAVLEVDQPEPLEAVFRAMNVVDGSEIPVKLRRRSMSVGDVAVESDGTSWVVAPVGFARCERPSRTRVSLDTPTFVVS